MFGLVCLGAPIFGRRNGLQFISDQVYHGLVSAGGNIDVGDASGKGDTGIHESVRFDAPKIFGRIVIRFDVRPNDGCAICRNFLGE